MIEIRELERPRDDNGIGFVPGEAGYPSGKELGYGASANKRENDCRGGRMPALAIDGVGSESALNGNGGLVRRSHLETATEMAQLEESNGCAQSAIPFRYSEKNAVTFLRKSQLRPYDGEDAAKHREHKNFMAARVRLML